MPTFHVNVAVHFIRTRSNLILSCPSEGFPIYAVQWKEDKKARYREGEKGEGARTVE